MKQEDRFQTKSGISIWAYLFSDTIKIDPERDKPDYITQSNVKGEYVLKNLSVGKYRLFAVDDLNRDQVWNPDKEAIGVSTQDVELTSNDVSQDHIDFILALRDTTKPTLLNCQALNKNQVRLDFNESLRGESVLNPDNFKIASISTSESLKIKEVYFSEGSIGEESNTRNVFILTAGMNPEEKYEVKVYDLEDESGNLLDSNANTCLFMGSSIFDTSGPKIVSTSPEKGETNVSQDAEIILVFDEPPSHPSVESSFSLSDSNDISRSGKSRWMSPNTFIFCPDTLLLGRMKYQIKLRSENVLDFFRNAMADSVLLLTFTTLNPDTLGSVSGLVLKTPPEVETLGEDISEKIVVTLSQMDNTKIRYQRSLPQPGLFLFENVLPGKYMAGAYIDLNGDENLTIGKPKPFILSEPFTFFPDTVGVRSHWETQGVELKFR
ncbi:MAG: Ig-like domain-containing protein [Candidatus Zixiibacteriota bacterium]